jgi:hypothetical protein
MSSSVRIAPFVVQARPRLLTLAQPLAPVGVEPSPFCELTPPTIELKAPSFCHVSDLSIAGAPFWLLASVASAPVPIPSSAEFLSCIA